MAKIKPYLNFEALKYCKDPSGLVYFMSGYFESFTTGYNDMNLNEIKEKIEDLKVCFDFLERF